MDYAALFQAMAAEVTRKIRDEISRVRMFEYGEVSTVAGLSNGGWSASVTLPGADTETIPLNCLSHYIPVVGDWVMIAKPPGSDPVIIGEAPAATNTIETPADLYASVGQIYQFKRSYTLSVNDWQTDGILLDANGNELSVSGGAYLVLMQTKGTGTRSAALYLLYSDPTDVSPSYTSVTLHESGTTSNHPNLVIDTDGKPKIKTAHTTRYTIAVVMTKC